MKSTEVYRELRLILSPWFKEHSYQRTKSGMLGWYRRLNGRFLVVWFQCSQSGWDPHAGSQFTMEFARTTEPLIGTGDRRARLQRLLPDNLFQDLRAIRNSVVARLKHPPRTHEIFQAPPEVQRWYMRKFEIVFSSYSSEDDIWLRYSTEDDVCRWGEFILLHLPQIAARAESYFSEPREGAA
jgi:hypothetical protein